MDVKVKPKPTLKPAKAIVILSEHLQNPDINLNFDFNFTNEDGSPVEVHIPPPNNDDDDGGKAQSHQPEYT